MRGDNAFVSFEPAAKGGPPPKPGSRKPRRWKRSATRKSRAGQDRRRRPEADEADPPDHRRPETEGIEFSPDGKTILVTNEADNTVTLHEHCDRQAAEDSVDTEKYGNRPRGIKVSPDGKHYVVTLEYGDNFLVLDSKLKPLKAVPTGKSPYGVSFDRAGKRLFVAAAKDKKLQVFDTGNFEKIAEMPTGDRCWHFTFTPDDKQILLACGHSNDIHVFDALTYRADQADHREEPAVGHRHLPEVDGQPRRTVSQAAASAAPPPRHVRCRTG